MNYLFIYKSSGLEPTFIEIINPKKISSLVVYIDIQQGISMNYNYLNILLPAISKEKKNVFLLGDFNVYLLKYDKHARRNDIMGSLSSYMFFFHISYIQLE